MKRLLTILLTLFAIVGYTQEPIPMSDLPTSGDIQDDDLFVIVQNSSTKKMYAYELKDYLDLRGFWQESGSDIYVQDKQVGINTSSPNFNLDVVGFARFDSLTTKTAITDTLRFSDGSEMVSAPDPAEQNNFVDSIIWNDTDNGVLRLQRKGLTDLTQDIDGRYLQTENDPVFKASVRDSIYQYELDSNLIRGSDVVNYEEDPIFDGHLASNITIDDTTWWGNNDLNYMYGNKFFISDDDQDTLNLNFNENEIKFSSSDSVYIEKLKNHDITAGHYGDSVNYTWIASDTIVVESAKVRLYTNDNFRGALNRTMVPADTFYIDSDNVRYIGAFWNGGNPEMRKVQDRTGLNMSNGVPLLTIYKQNGNKYISDWTVSNGLMERTFKKDIFLDRYERQSGLILDTLNSLNIQVSSGTLWQGGRDFDLEYVSSLADSMYWYYYDGTNWQYQDTTDIITSYYNDETGLQTLSNNNYVSVWFFRAVCCEPAVFMVVDDEQYNKLNDGAVTNRLLPENLPNAIKKFSIFLGRVVLEKDATAVDLIELSDEFTDVPGAGVSSSGVTDHGNLTGLDDASDHPWAVEWSDTTNNIATKYDIDTVNSDDQTISTNGTAGDISIENGNSITLNVDDADASQTNEIQDISTDNTAGNISISDGSTLNLNVDDADANASNELQNISGSGFSSNTLTIGISDGTNETVDLSSLDDSGTDDQTLSIDSTNRVFDLSIENGNTVSFQDTDTQLSESEVQTAINNDSDHGSTASHNYYTLETHDNTYHLENYITSSYPHFTDYTNPHATGLSNLSDYTTRFESITIDNSFPKFILNANTTSSYAALRYQEQGINKWQLAYHQSDDYLYLYDYTRGARILKFNDNGNTEFLANNVNITDGNLQVDGTGISYVSGNFNVGNTTSTLNKIELKSKYGTSSSTSAQLSIDNSAHFKITKGAIGHNPAAITPAFIIDQNGNVGIGTTSPATALDVAGDITVSGLVDGVGIASFKSSYDSHTGGNQHIDWTSATDELLQLTQNSGGKVIQFVNSGSINTEMYTDGTITTSGNITANNFILSSSDRRLKHNIRPISDALTKALFLNPVQFNHNKDNRADIGFIAQNVQKMFPELVHKREDGYLSLSYQQFTAVNNAAIHELYSEFQSLKKENQKLRNEVEKLKSKVNEICKQLED